ncbi:MAG TPA: hypothetical protein VE007_02155 [Thermoanaerobaculia bacterium]|nr:hypothetical protein [Thermoanaerobaculia bacterium]
MPQTRMFRDRVVSMEQTLEGGEKNLEFLKAICREALPEFEYREHFLEHERDLFVMALEAPDGRKKRVCWTRMVLFDAERLPALVENPVSPLRSRILAYIQARVARPEIVVTFRHLEDGWVDTPEPRREKRRGRRGGREGRGRQGVGAPPAQAQAPSGRPGSQRERERERKGGRGGGAPRAEGGRQRQRGGGAPRGGVPQGGSPQRAPQGDIAREARNPAAAGAAREALRGTQAEGAQASSMPPMTAGGDAAAGEARPGGRRRRFRRRRRGRGGAPGSGGTSGGGGAPGGGGGPGGGGPAGGA